MIKVDNELFRYKHWFQLSPDELKQAVEYSGPMERQGSRAEWVEISGKENPKTYWNDTFLIVSVRDPYDWMESMRQQPHHYPNHVQYLGEGSDWPHRTVLPWKDFAERELALPDKPAHDGEERRCCYGYTYGTLSPCACEFHYKPPALGYASFDNLGDSLDNPIYEQKPDGTPYKTLLELRAAKIHNFLDLPKKWDFGAFVAVRYEDLIVDGTISFIRDIAKQLGVKQQCKPKAPKKSTLHYPLDEEWMRWITDHADWEAEARMGFYPRGPGADAILKRD
jgi:hypothetical protein